MGGLSSSGSPKVQYELAEKAVLSTTTSEATYNLTTAKPVQILIVADGDDHLVEPNVDALSNPMKIFDKGSIVMPGKVDGAYITKIRYKADTTSATLRIWVWK